MSLPSLGAVGPALSESMAVACGVRKVSTFARGAEPKDGAYSRCNTDTLFYDGSCALCHKAVRFVLARDPRGNLFRYAPLQGETFRRTFTRDQYTILPDSLFVHKEDGTILIRSDAWAYILRQCGGPWRIMGSLLGLVPRPVRDAVYDFIAYIRYPVFGRRADMCPVVPSNLRTRFDP
jgi:predicted DCC family thiol-disulfide oxidoreductase YuxK